jgi:hypothetical protein
LRRPPNSLWSNSRSGKDSGSELARQNKLASNFTAKVLATYTSTILIVFSQQRGQTLQQRRRRHRGRSAGIRRPVSEAVSRAERESIASVIKQPVRYLVSSPFHDPFSKGNLASSRSGTKTIAPASLTRWNTAARRPKSDVQGCQTPEGSCRATNVQRTDRRASHNKRRHPIAVEGIRFEGYIPATNFFSERVQP